MDGRSYGEFSAHLIGEGADLRLHGGRHYKWKRQTLRSRFSLIDPDGKMVAEATRRIVLSNRWDLSLSVGEAEFIPNGLWFNRGYHVVQNNKTIATAKKSNILSRDWSVADFGSLAETDLLLVGLLFSTILTRRRNED